MPSIRAPALPLPPSWWPWRWGSGPWTCPSPRSPSGSGSTGSSRARFGQARRFTPAGPLPRSARRWEARLPRSWFGGWTCTPPTGRFARRARSGRACGARPSRHDLGAQSRPGPVPRSLLPLPLHPGGDAAAARRARRRKLPRRPRPPNPLRLQPTSRPTPLRQRGPGQPVADAGAAREQPRRLPTMASRPRPVLPRPQPRHHPRPTRCRRRSPPPARSAA
jgi:hypothetical protein